MLAPPSVPKNYDIMRGRKILPHAFPQLQKPTYQKESAVARDRPISWTFIHFFSSYTCGRLALVNYFCIVVSTGDTWKLCHKLAFSLNISEYKGLPHDRALQHSTVELSYTVELNFKLKLLWSPVQILCSSDLLNTPDASISGIRKKSDNKLLN